MTLAERGLYRELIDYCWEHGSIPADENLISRLVSVSDADFAVSWPRVKTEFTPITGTDGKPRLTHRKVDEKRPLLIETKDKRSEAARRNGTKGGRPKKPNDNQLGLQEQNPEKPVRARTPSPSPSPVPEEYVVPDSSSSREGCGEGADCGADALLLPETEAWGSVTAALKSPPWHLGQRSAETTIAQCRRLVPEFTPDAFVIWLRRLWIDGGGRNAKNPAGWLLRVAPDKCREWRDAQGGDA